MEILITARLLANVLRELNTLTTDQMNALNESPYGKSFEKLAPMLDEVKVKPSLLSDPVFRDLLRTVIADTKAFKCTLS